MPPCTAGESSPHGQLEDGTTNGTLQNSSNVQPTDERKIQDSLSQRAENQIVISGENHAPEDRYLPLALKTFDWSGVPIASIGVSDYKYAEPLETQASVTRYLVAHHKARVVMLDVPRDRAMVLNELLKNPTAPIRDFVATHHHKAWSSSHTLSMLTWIQEWNQANPYQQVEIAGLRAAGIDAATELFQLMGTENDPLSRAIVVYGSDIKKFHNYAWRIYSRQDDAEDAIPSCREIASQLRAQAASLNKYLQDHLLPTISKVDSDTLLVNIPSCKIESNLLRIAADTLGGIEAAIDELANAARDKGDRWVTVFKLMADEANAALDLARRQESGAKVVILAPISITAPVLPLLGGLLHEKYGDTYVSIGQ